MSRKGGREINHLKSLLVTSDLRFLLKIMKIEDEQSLSKSDEFGMSIIIIICKVDETQTESSWERKYV